MKDFCAIISGGEFSSFDDISEAGFVIAVDKGYEYACEKNIQPNLLVGDFDSCKCDIDTSIPILNLPVEKDDTDTMAAIRYAIDMGYNDIVVYCALGGRLDHLLGNLQAMSFAAERGAQVTVKDSLNKMFIISNKQISIKKEEGYSLSVLSLSDICEDVCLEGLKYPLDNARLTNKFPMGISNEWSDETATVKVGNGILLVILSKL